MTKPAEGCCSAVSPCSWQRTNPTTICDVCRAASPSVSQWLAEQEAACREAAQDVLNRRGPDDPSRTWHLAQAAAYEAAHAYAVARPEKQGGAGAGWCWVPEEATEAMWQAGYDADEAAKDSYSAVYRAMIAAAPNPPAGEAVSPTPPTDDLAKLSAGAREATVAVVRAAWALVDNTGHHDLLPLAINRDDWDELSARFVALKALLPDDELPADPPHTVVYFWPTKAEPVHSAPAAPQATEEPVAWTSDREDIRKSLGALSAAADALLITLPDHWHDDATIELTDAANDARAVLSAAAQNDLYEPEAAPASPRIEGER